MVETVQAGLMQATEIARQSKLRQSSNGLRYASFGENNIEGADLDRIVQAVPEGIARRLGLKAYYFVPLALMERGEESNEGPGHPDPIAAGFPDQSSDQATMIATTYTAELSDRAICHRNVRLDAGLTADLTSNQDFSIDGVFISTRLLADRFALAFEFYINVGHAFVDVDGVPPAFAELVWKQALAGVRGETSLDAWEGRGLSLPGHESATQTGDPRSFGNFGTIAKPGPADKAVAEENAANEKATPDEKATADEKAKLDFFEAAFSDTVAIYLLSLAIDFDYAELRERDYPLLAPNALADRLRLAAKLFPPNAGYDFSVRYRRRR